MCRRTVGDTEMPESSSDSWQALSIAWKCTTHWKYPKVQKYKPLPRLHDKVWCRLEAAQNLAFWHLSTAHISLGCRNSACMGMQCKGQLCVKMTGASMYAHKGAVLSRSCWLPLETLWASSLMWQWLGKPHDQRTQKPELQRLLESEPN